jgi:exopolysaccharide production protein ExoZ
MMNYPLKFVQILRGLAAVSVVLYHLDIESFTHLHHRFFSFSHGALGVDFFFTLSGFIITYIHLNDIRYRGSASTFIVRRFIRIYPFYWLCVIAVLLIHPEKFAGWMHLLQNLLLFRLPMPELYISVAWSLTFEVIFYIAFAVAIAAGWNFTRFLLAGWIILIIINYGDVFASSPFISLVASNMVIEFLCGCIAGYLFVSRKADPPKLLLPLFIAGGIFVCTTLLIYGYNRFSLVMTLSFGITASFIVFFAATCDRIYKHNLRAPRVLVLLGDASYAIYLTHTILIGNLFAWLTHSFNVSGDLSNISIILLVFFVTVSVGVAIHLLIEKPMLVFLRKKTHFLPFYRSHQHLHKV